MVLLFIASMRGALFAQDFFPQSKARPEPKGPVARVIVFLGPGCKACPEEARRVEDALRDLGISYQEEGVFLGSPRDVGKYISDLRSYPFRFDLGLGVDMDGSVARRYGVGSYPAIVVQWKGKTIVLAHGSQLKDKIKVLGR